MSDRGERLRIVGMRATGGPLYQTALPLKPGLTVLYGLNGSGKTWILDCLHACLSGTFTRLDGRDLPESDEPMILVEANDSPDRALDEFDAEDNYAWLDAGPQEGLFARFLDELRLARTWAFVPTWSGEPEWVACLAMTPSAGSAARRLFDADQVLKRWARMDANAEAPSLDSGWPMSDYKEWLKGWPARIGAPDLEPPSRADVARSLRVFSSLDVLADRGGHTDELPLDPDDGLPVPLADAIDYRPRSIALEVDLLVEGDDESHVQDVREILKATRIALRTPDGWEDYPPRLIDRSGVTGSESVPGVDPRALSAGVNYTVALHTINRWARTLSDTVNLILSRFLLDPPRLQMRITDRPQALLLGQSLAWITQQGVPLEELSRAERRWARLAIRLAVRATTSDGANVDESDDDEGPSQWSGEQDLGLTRTTFILMDEPEAALHRAAEAHLAQGLKWLATHPRVHVVVATHSPQLLDDASAWVYRVHTVMTEQVRDGQAVQSRMAKVTELNAVTRREMEDLGLQPSDLLQRYRAFLLVEGHHDDLVLRGVIGGDLDRMRIAILPLRGASRLPSTLDSRFLYEFTDAAVIPVVDNMSAERLTQCWNEALTIAATQGSARAAEHIRAALPPKDSSENLFMGQYLSRATDMDVRSRIAPYSFSGSDIVHYLPIHAFVSRGGASWEGLWAEHKAALAAGHTRIGDAKEWISKTFATDFSDERITAAIEMISDTPDEFQALVDYCDLIVSGLLIDR